MLATVLNHPAFHPAGLSLRFISFMGSNIGSLPGDLQVEHAMELPGVLPGAVTPATFERGVQYVIERYFRHPSYWKIDSAPYFSN